MWTTVYRNWHIPFAQYIVVVIIIALKSLFCERNFTQLIVRNQTRLSHRESIVTLGELLKRGYAPSLGLVLSGPATIREMEKMISVVHSGPDILWFQILQHL